MLYEAWQEAVKAAAAAWRAYDDGADTGSPTYCPVASASRHDAAKAATDARKAAELALLDHRLDAAKAVQAKALRVAQLAHRKAERLEDAGPRERERSELDVSKADSAYIAACMEVEEAYHNSRWGIAV